MTHEPREVRAPRENTEDKRITEALRPIVSACDMDLESVKVSAAGRRRVLRVVVDSDRGVSLDDAARVSRELSLALDRLDLMGDFPYTLEVSSPGVDRPLTEPRHWRRATGRLATVTVADQVLTGRVVLADDEAVILDTEGVRSRFPYPVLGPGKIQVEFGNPATEPDAADDADEPDGANRDGH